MSTKYTHLPLAEDVEAFAGYYTPEKEVRLGYNSREVLYVTGRAVVESACADSDGNCVAARWIYAIVPGYIVSWQNTKNEDGLPVSETEPISDKAAKEDIRRILETNEAASLVGFW